jgi:hypothetical protein
MHGKMVLGIVSSQTLVYILLFVGTFPPAHISRRSFVCVAQASLTYYFILCSFLWMSAMSYNIMTKFRLEQPSVVHRFARLSLLHFYSQGERNPAKERESAALRDVLRLLLRVGLRHVRGGGGGGQQLEPGRRRHSLAVETRIRRGIVLVQQLLQSAHSLPVRVREI